MFHDGSRNDYVHVCDRNLRVRKTDEIMRDYVLTVLVFALLPVCLVRPWLGILAWFWIGLMNPHRLTWGFAYTMPFAMLVGVATLLGAVLAKDRRPIPWNRE